MVSGFLSKEGGRRCFILASEKNTKEQKNLGINLNKNALSSVESRALGVKPPELLYYFFVWNTKRVLYIIMYILKNYKKLQGETSHTS